MKTLNNYKSITELIGDQEIEIIDSKKGNAKHPLNALDARAEQKRNQLARGKSKDR